MDLPFRKLIDMPPLWTLGAIALVWMQARFLPVSSGVGTLPRNLGVILILIAAALFVFAIIEFRRHRTTIIPHQNASAIVTTGVFALSRNPIYLADVLVIAGLALWWQAYPSLLLIPIFMTLITRRFIQGEEARLHAAFAQDFESYARKVRRWL